MVLPLLIALYLLGAWLAYWMQKTEVVAEGDLFTIGNQVVAVIVSLFSWLAFFILVCRGWFMYIKGTGYWRLPADKELRDGGEISIPDTKLRGTK